MKISDINIGKNYPPVLFGEISGNHNKSMKTVKNIIKEYSEIGGKFIKFQTFKPETMTLNSQKKDFSINTGLGKGYTLFELFSKSFLPWEMHHEIFDYARELDLIPFSSPFDKTAVDFLEELNCPAYKIASYENIDIPLIEYAASKGKPLIISSGMSSLSEIYDAYLAASKYLSKENISILKCTSSYPAPLKDINTSTLKTFREIFSSSPIGFSDHSLGIGASCAAIAFGANIIEKHIFDAKSPESIDSSFALNLKDTKLLLRNINEAWSSIGKPTFDCTHSEIDDRNSRRSLYFAKDLKKGEKLNKESLRCVRPGYGLDPKYYELLIGKIVNQDIENATPVSWDHFFNS